MIRKMYVILPAVVGILVVFFMVREWQTQKYQRHLAALAAEAPVFAMDSTTPEGAILVLEQAYRKHDIEAAVASKDFESEARYMLKNLKKDFSNDPEILSRTTKTLESTFRQELESAGDSWPNFSDVKSFFVKREPYDEKIVIVTEICQLQDGTYTEQRLLVADTPLGWKTMFPLD